MDPYQILNVSKDATDSQIKKAYRELSFKNHPDKNPGIDTSDKMQQINEAYEILGDPARKEAYDNPPNPMEQMLHDLFKRGDDDPFIQLFQGHGFGQGFPGQGFQGQGFQNMFQGQGFPTQGFPGHFHFSTMQTTLETAVELTYEQAFLGHTIPIVVERIVQVGGNHSKVSEKIYVNTCPGIDHGECIEIPEKGNQFQQHKGSLRILIEIKDHPTFKRKGLDLVYPVQLPFKDTICGFELTIQHLDGTQYKIKNNPGNVILNGQEKNVKGKGFVRDERRGDLILQFQVLPPPSFSMEQIAILETVLS
jgi:DnaJ-class molecular chaperone